MTLAEAITALDTGQSLGELTQQINDLTTVKDGLAGSGRVLAYLASINKLTTIENLAATENALRDAAKATLITLQHREGFDFSLTETDAMLQAFVAVNVLTQDEADYIKSLGQVTVKQFPGVREVDIEELRQ